MLGNILYVCGMENLGMSLVVAAGVVATVLFLWWMIYMQRTVRREIDEYRKKLDQEREEHNASRKS